MPRKYEEIELFTGNITPTGLMRLLMNAENCFRSNEEGYYRGKQFKYIFFLNYRYCKKTAISNITFLLDATNWKTCFRLYEEGYY
jgi:hypothetical protein